MFFFVCCDCGSCMYIICGGLEFNCLAVQLLEVGWAQRVWWRVDVCDRGGVVFGGGFGEVVVVVGCGWVVFFYVGWVYL